METTGKNGQIDKETLGLVLEEFTQEQKSANQSLQDLIAAVNTIGSKVDGLKNETGKQGAAPVATDTKAVRQIVQEGLNEVTAIFASQSKSHSRKIQVLLFPEQDAKLFYKIVFGRWLVWLVVLLLITNLYKWGIRYSDDQKEIKIEQLKNDRVQKSWDYLYNHSDKGVKRMMNRAYNNAERE